MNTKGGLYCSKIPIQSSPIARQEDHSPARRSVRQRRRNNEDGSFVPSALCCSGLCGACAGEERHKLEPGGGPREGKWTAMDLEREGPL